MSGALSHGGSTSEFEISTSNFGAFLTYLGFDDEDDRVLRSLKPWAEARVEDLMSSFYERQFKDPEFARIVQNAGSSRSALERAQAGYFLEWFDGRPNADYVEMRQRIGTLHARINVTPRWYLSSYQIYYDLLFPMLRRHYGVRIGAANRAINAITKLVTFDQAIIMDTYVTGLTSRLEGTLETLGTTAADVSRAVDEMATGAQAQAASVQQVMEMLTQISHGVDRVASGAGDTASSSDRTNQAADRGANVIREMIDGMDRIDQTTSGIAVQVDDLQAASGEIRQVIETIDSIARQTNLLALNAAIEAARAAEHGRGFAVVADEVRALAESSQRETQAINEVINRVGKMIGEVVDAIARGAQETRHGKDLATRVSASLDDILGAVDETAGLSQEIAANAQEISAAVRQVVDEVEAITAVVEESSASSEEFAAMADSLSAMANQQDARQPAAKVPTRLHRAA